jgi:hypothetical protein
VKSTVDIARGVGIFKSTDGGYNWEFLPSSLALSPNGLLYTQDLLVHPVTRDVYAATDKGLLRSQDFGADLGESARVLGLVPMTAFFDILYVENGDFLVCVQYE